MERFFGENVEHTPPLWEPASGQEERRRSSRFPLVVPIAVMWQSSEGKALQCEARAVEGNAHGGFVEIAAPPAAGSQIELKNLLSGATASARVVRVHHDPSGALEGIGIAFAVPSGVFWGPTFRLKKATAELRDLEQEIRSGGFHPQVLRDFRDAVDYVRKTAWAVQEWQERQMQRRDTATVLPLLTAERIRRTVQLSRAILAEVQSGEVTTETAGVAELREAVASLHRQLTGALR